jgi:uncharacterized protein involved in type VI secretion and phage assembly
MDGHDPMVGVLAGAMQARHYGKHRGQVASNVDAANRGRLQVSVPALLGDQLVWAMPCVPYAGDGVGLFALPPVGTGVWVEFEGGDLDYPLRSGCFWADGEIPASAATPEVKFRKTEAVSVRIDDAAGEIVIETQGGARLTISATEITAEASTVVQKALGNQTQLGASGFDVNNGAFTVI